MSEQDSAVQTDVEPVATEPEPILTHPDTLGGWVKNVLLAGALQAGGILLAGAILPIFLSLVFPIFTFLRLIPDELLSRFLTTTCVFLIGSIIAGHMYPHYAFFRGGVAFAWGILAQCIFMCYEEMPLMTCIQNRWTVLALLAVFGCMISAFMSSMGARAKRDFGQWVRDELDEFRDSLRPSAQSSE